MQVINEKGHITRALKVVHEEADSTSELEFVHETADATGELEAVVTETQVLAVVMLKQTFIRPFFKKMFACGSDFFQ